MYRLLTHSMLVLAIALNVALNATNSAHAAQSNQFDIVVYGGTSAAITSAIAAKRMGKSVVLVSPDKHLGGLTSGGLGWTDSGDKAVIGGLSREFYHRVWQKYQSNETWRWQSPNDYGNKGQGTAAIDGEQRTMWIFEPHVAEKVYETWLHEEGIRVDRDRWLDRENGVQVVNKQIKSITTLDGSTYAGKVFIDATYEGDLMAAAGISYHVGRESNETYGETFNGVQVGVLHHAHHFGVLKRRVDPYVVPGDASSGVIARVSPDPPGAFGSADKKIQAYCFRMCLTDHPDNRIAFAKPEGYDPTQYELMARVFAAGWMNVFEKFDPIPNRKTDTNNHGPMSTDNIGYNYDYPEADYARRREIIAEHEAYQRGWLYFLVSDPRVPTEIADTIRKWGLPKDEFVDNNHWPHQLYIREARRMVSDFVMTENHLVKNIPTPDSVGMGSYTMDSHNVQRYITPEGYVQNEGDIAHSTRGPYAIAYGSLVPKEAECQNLLVPVCPSSSHIAFGSIRMEPVFMILGHSAATAAAMAIDLGCSVQKVPYDQLAKKLLDDGQVLVAPATAYKDHGRGVDPKQMTGVVVDNVQAELVGSWAMSTSSKQWVGYNYAHDSDIRNGNNSATFRAVLPSDGRYEVRFAFPQNSNRASNVPVTIHHADGVTEVSVNQRKMPPIDDLSVSLGVFRFAKNTPAQVVVTNKDVDGYVVIDAVQWVPNE